MNRYIRITLFAVVIYAIIIATLQTAACDCGHDQRHRVTDYIRNAILRA
jgi:hypothetical protein